MQTHRLMCACVYGLEWLVEIKKTNERKNRTELIDALALFGIIKSYTQKNHFSCYNHDHGNDFPPFRYAFLFFISFIHTYSCYFFLIRASFLPLSFSFVLGLISNHKILLEEYWNRGLNPIQEIPHALAFALTHLQFEKLLHSSACSALVLFCVVYGILSAAAAAECNATWIGEEYCIDTFHFITGITCEKL